MFAPSVTRCTRTACTLIVYAAAWAGQFAFRPSEIQGENLTSPVRIARFYYGGAVPRIGKLAIDSVGFSKNADLLACHCFAWHGGSGGSRRYPPESFYLWRIVTGMDIRSDVPDFYEFATTPFARAYHWTDSAIELQDDLTDSTNIRTVQLKQMDLTPESRYNSAFFSADDQRVAGVRTRASTSRSVWNSQSGDLLGRFTLPDTGKWGSVVDVAFEADDRFVAAGFFPHQDERAGGLMVWDLSTGKQVLRQEQGFLVRQVAFCPNGDLVCAGDGTIMVMRPGELGAEEQPGTTAARTATFRTIQTLRPVACSCIALWSTGLVAGCAPSLVGSRVPGASLWDLATGKQTATLEDGENLSYNTRVAVKEHAPIHRCAGQLIPENATLIACTGRDAVDLFLIKPDATKK